MSRKTDKIKDEVFFVGGINTDDDLRSIPNGDYVDAVDVIGNEDGSGGILVNFRGNEVTYANPSGNAEYLCGWAYYKKNESVILFIYSIDRESIIIEFNPRTGSSTTLVDSSPSDVLGFKNPSSNDYFVDAKMLGDWLAWTDSLNPPRMINVQDIGSVTDLDTYLDLHKIPPIHPLKLSMGLDDTVVYNNITKGNQFKHRYVYNDFRASVYSPGSDIMISDVISRVDREFNLVGQENFINVQFNSGNSNVATIDLAVREGNTGTWFRFIKIKKASPENIYTTGGVLVTTALSNNTDYVYRFYNNEGKVAIGDDGDKQYDRVPEKCESLTFIGDNRLALGGNTEGKNLIDIDVTLTPQYNNSTLFYTISGVRTVGVDASTNGYLQLDFDLDDMRGVVLPGNYVYFDFNGSYLHSGGNTLVYALDNYTMFTNKLTTTADILTFLSANTPNPTNSGTPPPGAWAITVESGNILRFRFTSTPGSTFTTPGGNNISSIGYSSGYDNYTPYGYINDLAFKRGYSEKLALVYQDKYGVKFPALVSKNTNVFINTIASSSAGFSHIQYTINNVAPSDAVSYRWAYAYTPKSFVQTYITDVSYFEDVDGNINTELIALDISANNQFISPNYTVKVGDHIKIIEEGGDVTSLSGIFVDNISEFVIKEIKDLINDGTNDIHGQWLIISPSNEEGYNYAATGDTSLFMNSLVEIYEQLTSNSDTVYYEIGGGGTCVGGTTDHDDWYTGNATGYLNQGDIWVRPVTRYRRFGSLKTEIVLIVAYLEDPFPYINSPTKDVGIADPNVEVPESRNKYNNIIRWSNKFFQDTQINGLSTFDSDSKNDQISDIYGNIKGLEQLGKSLVVICEKKVLSGGIGYTEYLDAEGNVNQVKSDSVIGYLRASNSRYGTFLKESILNTGQYIYFFDLYNKAVVRKAYNGLFPISGKSITPSGAIDYKMRTYYSQLSDNLVSSLSGGNIWDVKVYMGYDVYYENVYITFKDDNNIGNNVSLIFNESQGRWKSRYTGYIDSKSVMMYPWTDYIFMSYWDGELYRQNSGDSVDRCFLYGEQQNSLIKFVPNKLSTEIKIYNNLGVRSNDKWHINSDNAIVIPENETYGEMSSSIPDGRWRLEEGVYWSDFLRNAKSTSGAIKLIDLHTGELLRGYVIIIEMINSSTDEVKLFKVDMESELSK